MESNRILPTESTITLNLDKNIFNFVKNMKVGDKGILHFNGIVKSHKVKTEYNDEEVKNIQLLNLKLNSRKIS